MEQKHHSTSETIGKQYLQCSLPLVRHRIYSSQQLVLNLLNLYHQFMKTKYSDRYQQMQVLGRGAFGVAYLVHDKKAHLSNTYQVAKKVFLKSMKADEKQKSLTEVEILQKLNSPFIVKYVDSFMEDGELIVIMQYCEEGDLAFYIQNHKKKKTHISQQIIANWFVQLCLGLKHIHSNKILHRDIKSNNIFLNSNGTIKIGDFGISKVLQTIGQSAHSFTGTPYYLSPEVCSSQSYGYKSDIWALGCVLYELCTLNYAFQAMSLLAIVKKIVEDKVERLPKTYSEELNNIILKLLNKDAKHRPTIDEILETPYLKKQMLSFVNCGGRLKMHIPVKGTPLHETIKSESNSSSGYSTIKQQETLTPKQLLEKRKEQKARQRQQELANASRQNFNNTQNSKSLKQEHLHGRLDQKRHSIRLIETKQINKALASETYKKKNAQIQREIYEDMSTSLYNTTSYSNPNDERPLHVTLKKQQLEKEKEIEKEKLSKSQKYQEPDDDDLSQYNDEDFEQYQEEDIRITAAATEGQLQQVSQEYQNQLKHKEKNLVPLNKKQPETKHSESFLDAMMQNNIRDIIKIIGKSTYEGVYKYLNDHKESMDDEKLYREIIKKFPKVKEEQIQQIDQIIYMEGFKRTQ